MNDIVISTTEGTRYVSKDKIIQALLSFDQREPDKTYSLWQDIAGKLYRSGELRVEKKN